tara:strand:+ start:687 stop:950 length:264 start_codon:yes stop_codon:yes gene_type:complete
MPRLPRNVPLSEPADMEGKIKAALVFACTACWSTNYWGFTAYNQDGHVFQVRRCQYWSCFGNEGKGKWITQDEAHERTLYQIRGDEL